MSSLDLIIGDTYRNECDLNLIMPSEEPLEEVVTSGNNLIVPFGDRFDSILPDDLIRIEHTDLSLNLKMLSLITVSSVVVGSYEDIIDLHIYENNLMREKGTWLGHARAYLLEELQKRYQGMTTSTIIKIIYAK